MSLFGGDNELGNILQDAVKLKSAQMGQKRQTYEKWPFFVQHTIFHGEKGDFHAWRQLPFAEKVPICERIKDEGNELFAKGAYSDAVDKYEEAPTLMYYCYSTDPGWRKNNRGIDDDVIVFVDDKGSTDEDARQQKRLRLSCCLNLAACKQKLEKYDEAIAACDVALELDPRSVKGLYRRAVARIRPAGSTAYDLDLAIKDLAKAQTVEPNNNLVEILLKKLRGERKEQREKDAETFTGMFGRGEIYDKNMEGAQDPCKAELPMREIQEKIEKISDDDPLEKRCEDAELLRDLYMRNGKEDEAKELNEKIKAAKAALKDPPQATEQERPKLDWMNPTPEMIEDAKKYSLDLTDPRVVQELQRLEHEGVPPEGSTAEDESSDASGLPEFPSGVDVSDVPWLQYAAVLCVTMGVWRLIGMGVLRWTLASCIGGIGSGLHAAGLAVPEDVEDERSTGVFSSTYRWVAAAVGGGGDDGDGEL